PMTGNTPMRRTSAEKARRRFGTALVVALAAGIAWFFSPGLPVLWGPSASAAVKAEGKALFEHEWQPNDPLAHGDGLGPVYNARSCVACHFQGGVGGGGDGGHNIRNFEVLPNRRDGQLRAGTVHYYATAADARESVEQVRLRFPVI